MANVTRQHAGHNFWQKFNQAKAATTNGNNFFSPMTVARQVAGSVFAILGSYNILLIIKVQIRNTYIFTNMFAVRIPPYLPENAKNESNGVCSRSRGGHGPGPDVHVTIGTGHSYWIFPKRCVNIGRLNHRNSWHQTNYKKVVSYALNYHFKSSHYLSQLKSWDESTQIRSGKMQNVNIILYSCTNRVRVRAH